MDRIIIHKVPRKCAPCMCIFSSTLIGFNLITLFMKEKISVHHVEIMLDPAKQTKPTMLEQSVKLNKLDVQLIQFLLIY